MPPILSPCFCIYSVAMVSVGQIGSLHGDIHNRLVQRTMAVFQLVGLCSLAASASRRESLAPLTLRPAEDEPESAHGLSYVLNP
jgi:hypothetical protein